MHKSSKNIQSYILNIDKKKKSMPIIHLLISKIQLDLINYYHDNFNLDRSRKLVRQTI